MPEALSASRSDTVVELLPQERLPDDLREKAGTENLRGFIEYCISAGRAEAAVDVLASVLPTRYLVTWVATCLELEAKDDKLAEEDPIASSCLHAVDDWLKAPSDERRHSLLKLAELGRYASPSAWLAACVGWSGGSILPADQAAIEVAPEAKGQAAAAALKLIAARVPADFESRLAGHLRQAIEMFAGNGENTI